jgi:hypothetical protein
MRRNMGSTSRHSFITIPRQVPVERDASLQRSAVRCSLGGQPEDQVRSA